MKKKTITIVVATAFQDAGDATRAIEIAKGLKKYQPADVEMRVFFLSRGSKFEQYVLDCGFEIYHAEPKMSGEGIHKDFHYAPEKGELIGEKSIAVALLKGELKAYRELRPDVVLYGFWPIAGVARRMMEKEIPGICFIPLPLTEAFLDVIPDVPEQVKSLAWLPYKIRMGIFRKIPKCIKKRIPLLCQSNIRATAYENGWCGERLENLFDLLRANLTLVNDLPDYYDQRLFPSNILFTGPVFARSEDDAALVPQISDIFSGQNKRLKVFCTLGSSGTQKQLLEMVRVFTKGEGLNWDAVILSPSAVCPIEMAREALGNRQSVYITDKFIPAQKVNSLADVAVCHGGQGTLQTTLVSGTPFVGVAMQQEQFINLCNATLRGAGIRISKKRWTSENIRRAIGRIAGNEGFKRAALQLGKRITAEDGVKKSAEIIWQFVQENKKFSN